MNFREELRKKKYNILEYKKVEEILNKVLKYFEEECFEKLDFSEKKINFLYDRAVIYIYVDKNTEIYKEKFNNSNIIFKLLKEKLKDEEFTISEQSNFFSVIINP